MRRAIAALVQPVAGGIQTQRDLILHHGKLHLIAGAGLREPLDPVDRFQPLDDGLLDDLLAVRYGKELGIEAVALDGKGPVARDDRLPGQGAGALKELVEAQCGKAAQLQQHALTDAQIDVGAGDGLRAAAEIDAPVFGGHVLQIHAPQLVGDRPLQTQQAGDGQ